MYSLCMSPLATSLAFSTKLVNLPIKDELATDHIVYSMLLVNKFERPCFKQTEHFTLSRVHELHAMLAVPRLPERLGHAEVLEACCSSAAAGSRNGMTIAIDSGTFIR